MLRPGDDEDRFIIEFASCWAPTAEQKLLAYMLDEAEAYRAATGRLSLWEREQMAKHAHGGGVIRRSREPVHANTNMFAGGTNGASRALDVAPDMTQPGGGVGPGTPAPDASTTVPAGQIPPGAIPR